MAGSKPRTRVSSKSDYSDSPTAALSNPYLKSITIKSPTGPSFFLSAPILSTGWVLQSCLRRCMQQRTCKRDAAVGGTKFRWSRPS